MKRLNNHNSAFTLIEVLVATTIFVIVLMIGTAIFLLSLGVHNKVDILKANQQSARNIIESINKDMREANKIGINQQGSKTLDIILNDGSRVCYGLSDPNSDPSLGVRYNNFFRQVGTICDDLSNSTDFPKLNQNGTIITGLLGSNSAFYGQANWITPPASKNQPFVNIRIRIETDPSVFGNKNPDTMNINTTITLRNYEPEPQ